MVNTENMQKWIDALRSGEYRQIRLHLETLAGNCAEGVACREAIKAGIEMRVIDLGGLGTEFDGRIGSAPQAVLNWLGLDDNPTIGDDAVIWVNDHTDQTFEDIADGLYRQYLKEPKN